MEKLNDYLQKLLASCSDELRLEPDRNPYVISDNQRSDVANVPLLGTQISTMVFPIIPPHAKAQLPHNSEIEFVHPHNLGNFTFTVQKSPAGFIVTIRPTLSPSSESTPVLMPLPDAPVPMPLPDTPPPSYTFEPVADTALSYHPEPVVKTGPPEKTDSLAYLLDPEPTAAPYVENYTPASSSISPAVNIAYELESSSAVYAQTTVESIDTSTLEDLLLDEDDTFASPTPTGPGMPQIEIVSVNDPQFQTVFSDTAEYEPPGRRDDFDPSVYSSPTNEPIMQNVFANETAPPLPSDRPLNIPFQTPPDQAAEAAFVPSRPDPKMSARMDAMFHKMAEIGASDLHLSVSVGPMMRADGKMRPLKDGMTALTPEVMREMLTSIMPAKNQEEFALRHDTDFAYEIPGLARFRCNIFMDRKGMGGVFRIIPTKILTAEQLGLSKAIMDLCSLSKGLVVVTGPTGSGKSTTLCAMVDSINKTREDHIITIEDPIEFVHDNHKCLVNQREVHNHTDSFKDALRAALREDPDILLVGEMRDLETISIAIETAETGHLVFGTLHTTTAPSTVDRIIDQFPADRQQQIRVMLSESLKGVIAQTLLPKKGGGRVAALEVLVVTPAISNLIREGKTFQIPSAMQTGRTHGMVMLNDALFEHVKSGLVEPRDAYIKAVDKTGFEALLTRGGFKL